MLCQIGVAREQEGELVTAKPGDEIGAAQDRAKLARHALQQRIAGLVAERVVDFLEPVEIDEQKTRRLAGGAAAGDHRFQFVVEGAPVGQVGQCIVVGRMVALLLRQFDLALLRGQLLVGCLQIQQQLGIEVLDDLAVADVDDEAFEEFEFAGIIPDTAADLADPKRFPNARHDAVVDVPVAARFQRGVDGGIDRGQVVRMDGRDIVAHRVVDEIARSITADGENAVADIEHGVGRIVAAAVKVAVHPAGDAEKRIQALVVIGSWPTTVAGLVSCFTAENP